MRRERVVVFDLDGTLTNTNGVDADAFLATCRDLWGAVEIDTTWESYPHATDHGIVSSVHHAVLGRPPADGEIAAFRDRFAARLSDEGERTPRAFETIPGAARAIASLRAETGTGVALATGCFERTARIKLRFAGLDLTGLPAAFSEDGPAREDVLRTARRRAGPEVPVVYVGDAIWDARTCRALGWPLVGRATGEQAERLRAEGVTHVLPDLTDLDALRAALAEADVPQA